MRTSYASWITSGLRGNVETQFSRCPARLPLSCLHGRTLPSHSASPWSWDWDWYTSVSQELPVRKFMKPGAFSLPENYSQRLKLLHKASLKPELLPWNELGRARTMSSNVYSTLVFTFVFEERKWGYTHRRKRLLLFQSWNTLGLKEFKQV